MRCQERVRTSATIDNLLRTVMDISLVLSACSVYLYSSKMIYKKVRSLREAVKLRPSGRRYTDFP
ncbi:MAG: hypothetical protein ACP5LV_05755, partial [Thermoplasmata archaeon]